MNQRIEQWKIFSDKVEDHINNYCQKQYSDSSANKLTSVDCLKNIQRYIDRFGKGARGLKEQQRDLLKIAHYAQLAHSKCVLPSENKCPTCGKDI